LWNASISQFQKQLLTIVMMNHAFAGQLNYVAHLRALLVLYDCGNTLPGDGEL
jgi:hypothetical protein